MVRQGAAETLGIIVNNRVVPKIRDALDGARLLTKVYEEAGYLHAGFSKKSLKKHHLCWDNASLFMNLFLPRLD